MSPVRCLHCRQVYDLGFVEVAARYSDCTVWTTPCCGHRGVDDRPWVRARHYRELSKAEACGEVVDFYDLLGMRHRRH